MSIATLVGRKRQDNSAAKRGNWFTYPILPARQKVFQVHSYRFFKDERFGKAGYGFQRLAVKVVCLVEGADAVVNGTEKEQLAYRMKGHGAFFDIEFSTPALTPPCFNKAKQSAISPSGLYTFFSTLFYNGEEIPLADIGRLSAEELKVWMAENSKTLDAWVEEYRETLDEGDELPSRAEIAKLMLPAACLMGFLDRAVAEKVQFLAKPETKVRKNDARDGSYKAGDKYNVIRNADQVLAPEERLPDYRPFERPADPREENDNPLTLCSVTGARIRGWEGRDGWMSNDDWAKMQLEILGPGPFTFDDVEGEFSPPFSPRYYQLAKKQVSK